MRSFFVFLCGAAALFGVNSSYTYVSVGSYPVDVQEGDLSFRDTSKYTPVLNYGFRLRAGAIGLECLADTLLKHSTVYANLFLLPGFYHSPFVGIGGAMKNFGEHDPHPRGQIGYEWGGPKQARFVSLECTNINPENTSIGLRFGFKI